MLSALSLPPAVALQRAITGPAAASKEAGSIGSRRIHCLQFFHSKGWADDLTMENMERRRGNMQFAMYALHLATGNTLFCRCIKTATIKKYLLHVASLFWLFGPQQRDFRKSNNNDSGFTPELTKLYCELDRWETVPNRREPFTLEMLHELYSWASKSNVSLDSFLAAFQDWFTIGLFAGLGKSEWN
jgi:hypothetical protein